MPPKSKVPPPEDPPGLIQARADRALMGPPPPLSDAAIRAIRGLRQDS